MPEQCNATIQVGGETLTCRRLTGGHPSYAAHLSDGGAVEWTDVAPGAVPHTEPRRYSVMNIHGGTWFVLDEHATDNPYDDPTTIATFHGAHGQTVGHPDAECAAKREADRLNGTSVNVAAATASHQLGQALRERDRARADAARYRAALERIAHPLNESPMIAPRDLPLVAVEALEGVSRD